MLLNTEFGTPPPPHPAPHIRVVRVAGILGLCDCVIGYSFI